MMTSPLRSLRRALLSLAGVVAVASASAMGAERPNVILIFADDLGPGLLGSYGQQLIKTPHLDQLAAEGMPLQNSYGAVRSRTSPHSRSCHREQWLLPNGEECAHRS